MAKRAVTEDLETTEAEALAEGLIFEPGRVEGIDELRDAALFVTDYGADGEARDVPVTPPTADNPQAQFSPSQERQMHDGKPVTEHVVSFTGRVDIAVGWPHERKWFEALPSGKTGSVTLWFQVGGHQYKPTTDKGVITGTRELRELIVKGIVFPKAESDLDGLPMFESVANVNQDGECQPDGAVSTSEEMCFCGHVSIGHFKHTIAFEDEDGNTHEEPERSPCKNCDCKDFDALDREVEPDYSGLSESLGIALEEPECTTPGHGPECDGMNATCDDDDDAASDALCGKVHRGHADACPYPAAECELETVGV
jgi:hypothetical protein